MDDKPQHHYSNPKPKKNLSGYCDNDMCASCKVEWCDCDCHKKKCKHGNFNCAICMSEIILDKGD